MGPWIAAIAGARAWAERPNVLDSDRCRSATTSARDRPRRGEARGDRGVSRHGPPTQAALSNSESSSQGTCSLFPRAS
eukprot:9495274-Pyramimonas_sp.AAC.1